MANILGSLFVELKANTAAFVEGMSSAGSAAKKAGDDISTSLGGLRDAANDAIAAMGPLGSSVTQFAALAQTASLGVAGVATGLLAFTAATAESTAKLYEQAQSAGVSVETLSQLSFVAQSAGVSQDTLSMGLERLSKSAYATAEGGKGATEAYSELGIQLKNSDGTLRDARDIFADVAARFSAMPDGVEKTALAMQIFGRSGAELIPVLDLGKTKIEELMQRQRELGAVTSTETAKSAHEFKEAMTEVWAAVKGVGLDVEDLGLKLLNPLGRGVLADIDYLHQWYDSLVEVDRYLGLVKDDSMKVYHGAPPAPPAGMLGGVAETADPRYLLDANQKLEKQLEANQKAFEMYSAGAVMAKEKGEELLAQMKALADGTTICTNDNIANAGSLQQQDSDLSNLQLNMGFYNEKLKQAQAINDQYMPALEKYAKQQKILNDLVANYGLTQEAANKDLHDYGVQIGVIADDSTQATKKMTGDWRTFGDQLSTDLVDLTSGTRTWKTAIDDLLKSIEELLVKNSLFGSSGGGLFGFLGGLFKGIGGGGGAAAAGGGLSGMESAIGFSWLPGMAAGGYATGPTIVGESGPELFVPGTPGAIVPSGKFGVTHVYNIDARGSDPSVTRLIKDAMQQAYAQAVRDAVALTRESYLRS
ncbi:MAG TPA: phage tail tape measure protein [Candidatus Acidoferrales bacterium]|nr:phage tail tape measure protein [Candidatus Acidoferrales bacterium]